MQTLSEEINYDSLRASLDKLIEDGLVRLSTSDGACDKAVCALVNALNTDEESCSLHGETPEVKVYRMLTSSMSSAITKNVNDPNTLEIDIQCSHRDDRGNRGVLNVLIMAAPFLQSDRPLAANAKVFHQAPPDQPGPALSHHSPR